MSPSLSKAISPVFIPSESKIAAAESAAGIETDFFAFLAFSFFVLTKVSQLALFLALNSSCAFRISCNSRSCARFKSRILKTVSMSSSRMLPCSIFEPQKFVELLILFIIASSLKQLNKKNCLNF